MLIVGKRKYPSSFVQFTMFALLISCTACDSDEQSSGPVTNPPVDNIAPLSEANWEKTLDLVLEAVRAERLRFAMDSVAKLRLPDSSFDGTEGIESLGESVTFISADGIPGSIESARCLDGGGFELLRTSADFGFASIDANECVLGALSVDGKAELVRTNSPSYNDIASATFTDFSVVDEAIQLQMFKGTFQLEGFHPVATSTWSGVPYSYLQDGLSGQVSDLERVNSDIYGTSFDRAFSISFTLSAAWTNNQPIIVSTPTQFGGLTTSSTGDFTLGTLLVETAKGERLTLAADSGQPGSVLITLENGGAATTHFREWPEAFR